jgi:hypothetical protein
MATASTIWMIQSVPGGGRHVWGRPTVVTAGKLARTEDPTEGPIAFVGVGSGHSVSISTDHASMRRNLTCSVGLIAELASSNHWM